MYISAKKISKMFNGVSMNFSSTLGKGQWNYLEKKYIGTWPGQFLIPHRIQAPFSQKGT